MTNETNIFFYKQYIFIVYIHKKKNQTHHDYIVFNFVTTGIGTKVK